jgi:PilZ domain
MYEKRRAPRLKEDNEVTIFVVSGREPLPREKVIYNRCKDFSESGARINAHILLPVDTLIKIDITLKTVHQMITVMGKVKWIKIICDDESYEEGVEFVNTADEAIKKLKDYISWKQKKTSRKPL